MFSLTSLMLYLVLLVYHMKELHCKIYTEALEDLCAKDDMKIHEIRLDYETPIVGFMSSEYYGNCSIFVVAPINVRMLVFLRGINIKRFRPEENCINYLRILDGANSVIVCGQMNKPSLLAAYESYANKLFFQIDTRDIKGEKLPRMVDFVVTTYKDGVNNTCPFEDMTFVCNNGRCILPNKKCNDINECGDFSDEYTCFIREMTTILGYAIISYFVALATALVFYYFLNKKGKHRQFDDTLLNNANDQTEGPDSAESHVNLSSASLEETRIKTLLKRASQNEAQALGKNIMNVSDFNY